ncbi:hypothetical protein M0804_008526 [Polistes exclamans]|nr:hypothetical protein M0804_008526 [Polistes exclamans]
MHIRNKFSYRITLTEGANYYKTNVIERQRAIAPFAKDIASNSGMPSGLRDIDEIGFNEILGLFSKDRLDEPKEKQPR